ncbi:major facilitator superfamily domain-containing protein [Massariosphaeria phaeospora]|uniref:Major facilitator superfamily domain-containing protein n=1 Tax=Massariosphaeria phaeospora TaxID=100035 RepID=A0A7C8HYN6_9PLEO|nr:major facilitator superfamily domain-containing protein [Massariosphaeria phaeospora]
MPQAYELAATTAPGSPTMRHDEGFETPPVDRDLHKRTLRKLDFLLLPFLALLFLFNSLDKSNIGNAESAHFTRDIGLERSDLNTAVALFFAFFVTLQPAGAALGRRYGMVAWVPSCMVLWGISTALHTWVRAKWQLYTLRILIGCLEAGFYACTVSYLSLFYTRYEFGRRLSLFYGQAAVGGALGGILSYIVFSRFPDNNDDHEEGTAPALGRKWQSWQILFLLEGSLTIVVAFVGYFWLPHSVETAWFLTPVERAYASSRVIQDRAEQTQAAIGSHEEQDEEAEYDEESRGLLNTSQATATVGIQGTITDDRGLTPHDILAAIVSPNIWHILACNILSAIPVYAFSVFLPLVLAPFTETPNPALVNLLTAPPYICGATTLYFFASYSDKHRKRITPVLSGLVVLITGLFLVVLLPTTKAWAIPRYLALNVLLSGTFIASPLTVAWISGNTPSPGKRALLLGINGWGNLAGIISAMFFKPKYADTGYIIPFIWTLACVSASAGGYVLFWRNLKAENARRRAILSSWDEADVEKERLFGQGPLDNEYRIIRWVAGVLKKFERARGVVEWWEDAAASGREGDERLTFVYGL